MGTLTERRKVRLVRIAVALAVVFWIVGAFVLVVAGEPNQRLAEPTATIADENEPVGERLISDVPDVIGEAIETVTQPWARTVFRPLHLDVTELGVLSYDQLLELDADGWVAKASVPLGTCDDVDDCLAHAKKACDAMDKGKPSSTAVEKGNCVYKCGDGTQGVVTCVGVGARE